MDLVASVALKKRPQVLWLAATSAYDLTLGLFKEPLTPGLNLVLADVTPADFVGYTQCEATSPRFIRWLDPNANGFRWDFVPANPLTTTVAGTTGLPQTIYGQFLFDNTPGFLYAVEVFDAPYTLTQLGEGVPFDRHALYFDYEYMA